MSITPIDSAITLLTGRSDNYITPPIGEIPLNPSALPRPGTSRDLYSNADTSDSNLTRAPGLDRQRLEPGAPRSRRKELPVRPVPAGLCKKLVFRATSADQDPAPSMESVQSLINRMQLDHDVEVSRNAVERESHEERLKELRELQKLCDREAWMYQPIEELLGFR